MFALLSALVFSNQRIGHLKIKQEIDDVKNF